MKLSLLARQAACCDHGITPAVLGRKQWPHMHSMLAAGHYIHQKQHQLGLWALLQRISHSFMPVAAVVVIHV